MIVPAAILLAVPYAFRLLLWRAPAALGVTIAFAFIAWALRGVTRSGAHAGALVTFIVFIAAGPPGFLAILTVFVLTAAATQIGYAKKVQLGTAEPRAGRSAQQVFANLLVAAVIATPALFFPEAHDLLMIAVCAALAEAAADTVSSEIGQAVGANAYLITGLQPVAVGQNGAVSVIGTICGVLSAALVCFACWWLRLLSPTGFLVALVAGTLGMVADSVLGATLERPGRLGNNSVNYLSTVIAASLALIAALFLDR